MKYLLFDEEVAKQQNHDKIEDNMQQDGIFMRKLDNRRQTNFGDGKILWMHRCVVVVHFED